MNIKYRKQVKAYNRFIFYSTHSLLQIVWTKDIHRKLYFVNGSDKIKKNIMK